ncbi:TetR/AcrR family transcriptional regulator [Nocardia nova]|jgi:AcrR family transcriptional regulator|uniref:TetR/AcrR family transcriptional regulator n=1 Tax=Nocardia nova TaxID=37330 RepID=UPI0025B1994E|nr:TetR/AcrR family transcriptional regulator [Nocardia nova]MDN2495719.1 TetR/AcrR family transcriptional regulator [Nocardia nova]
MERRPARDRQVDPRSVRSRAALSRAILEVAAERPIDRVTITALCERAGVTRRTFYNYAGSPVELLKQVLTAELDEIGARMRAERAQPGIDLAVAVRHSLGAMLEHVHRHRTIYRDTTTGRVHPELYVLLSDHFFDAVRHSIVTSVRRIPEIDGVRAGSARYPAAVDLHAAFVAHAYAGVIERSLGTATASRDFVLDIVLATLPGWMLGKE